MAWVVVVAWVQSLAWEFLHAVGMAGKKKKKKKKKEGKPLKCSDHKIKQNNNSNERSHWKVLGMTIALIVVMASLGYTYVQTDPIVHINYVQFFVN